MDLKSSRYKAWAFALGVHAFALLPFFWLEHSKPILQAPAPKVIINATIFGELPKPPIAKKPEPKAPQKPEAVKEAKPNQAKKQEAIKKQEEQKIADEKAIRIKQEAEKKLLEEKKKQEELEKAKQEEQKKLQAEQEAQKKAEELEQQKQKQIKANQEALQKRIQEATKQLNANNAKVAQEIDKLKLELIRSITQYWTRPIGMDKKLTVVIELVILSTGELSGMRIKQSSGNKAFDDSALYAAKSASPFSMFLKYSPQVRNESRITIIKFTPDDLFD